MKILTLNIWGGRAGKENLLAFLRTRSKDTDIFCLQEVWSAPYEHLEGALVAKFPIHHQNIMVYGKQEIAALLPEYEYFFHPNHLDDYGLMILVRKGIEVSGSGDIFVHKYREFVPEGDVGHHARNVQYVTLRDRGKATTICNFHGLWNGKGKGDSEDRITQSKNIVTFVNGLDGEVVLCGDFNLLPDTESIKILENAGFINLVTEYRITSTRTSYYTKPEKFADYIFVNKSVTVKNFKVLPDEVSDHSPLCVEIH